MTFDPYRSTTELSQVQESIQGLIEEFRELEETESLEEYERKAYGHAADKLDRVLKPKDHDG